MGLATPSPFPLLSLQRVSTKIYTPFNSNLLRYIVIKLKIKRFGKMLQSDVTTKLL